jgi:hypothetical protein
MSEAAKISKDVNDKTNERLVRAIFVSALQSGHDSLVANEVRGSAEFQGEIPSQTAASGRYQNHQRAY